MFKSYPACFTFGENSITVIFPDLNYLATQGKDLEDAQKMAIDCLAGYFYQNEDEENEPSNIKDINIVDVLAEIDCKPTEKDFVSMVSVDVDDYAKKHFEVSVKKTLTIPKWLNDLAIEQNANFSKILQDALKRKYVNR